MVKSDSIPTKKNRTRLSECTTDCDDETTLSLFRDLGAVNIYGVVNKHDFFVNIGKAVIQRRQIRIQDKSNRA
jgi:hypothetical protein